MCHAGLVGFSGAQLPEDNHLTWLCYVGWRQQEPQLSRVLGILPHSLLAWTVMDNSLYSLNYDSFINGEKKSIWIQHFSMYDLIFQNSGLAQSLSQVTRQTLLYSGPQDNPQVQMTQDGHCGTQTQWLNLTRKQRFCSQWTARGLIPRTCGQLLAQSVYYERTFEVKVTITTPLLAGVSHDPLVAG